MWQRRNIFQHRYSRIRFLNCILDSCLISGVASFLDMYWAFNKWFISWMCVFQSEMHWFLMENLPYRLCTWFWKSLPNFELLVSWEYKSLVVTKKFDNGSGILYLNWSKMKRQLVKSIWSENVRISDFEKRSDVLQRKGAKLIMRIAFLCRDSTFKTAGFPFWPQISLQYQICKMRWKNSIINRT